MPNNAKQFSVLERSVVVVVLVLVVVVAIQNVVQSVKASEQSTLRNAASQYAAVKNMYAEQRQIVPPSMVGGNRMGSDSVHNRTAH